MNKSGQLINEYDKVHLVPMLREHEFLTAGKNVAEPFQLSDGTYVTQLICYDLRFPELLRYPARSGAKIAFYCGAMAYVTSSTLAFITKGTCN